MAPLMVIVAFALTSIVAPASIVLCAEDFTAIFIASKVIVPCGAEKCNIFLRRDRQAAPAAPITTPSPLLSMIFTVSLPCLSFNQIRVRFANHIFMDRSGFLSVTISGLGGISFPFHKAAQRRREN